MSKWPSVKASKVLRALIITGWEIKRHKSSSHMLLAKHGWSDYVWSFNNPEEIGPKMLARIAKHTGLKQEHL